MDRISIAIAFFAVSLLACRTPSTLSVEPPTEKKTAINDNQDLDTVQMPALRLDTALTKVDTILWYSRSGCFGTCPAYSFVVFDTKELRYTGHRYATPEGRHSITLDSIRYAQFISLIKRASLEKFEENYPSQDSEWIADLPTSTIAWYDENRRMHIIRNNHSAPESLMQFEKDLATFLHDLPWPIKNE